MKKYREIMQEELQSQKCKICQYTFGTLCIHHIDGNEENNIRENLVNLCNSCHGRVHKRLTRSANELEETILSLRGYRKQLLMKKARYSNKKAEEILDYEMLIGNKGDSLYLNKSKCFLCKKRRFSIIFAHKLLTKYGDDSQILKYGIRVCGHCIEKYNFRPKTFTAMKISSLQ